MESNLKSQALTVTTLLSFSEYIQYWPLSQAIGTTQEWMDHWSVLLCQFLII